MAQRGRRYDFPPRSVFTYTNSTKISTQLLIFRNTPSYSTKNKLLLTFWNTALKLQLIRLGVSKFLSTILNNFYLFISLYSLFLKIFFKTRKE
ncbi:hypothetical protein RHMOL_Rhmol04G0253700 [Rhododendron molle]|uniref:Uncharacterized protein n=1 Tax=Rhododendron molle TaxID=49168 RepID=A0ACC0P4L8_RHOML|nr:hypothetical protein RHMOL_Rhmol04G0253700 [Rhododendron molle]